MPTATPWLAEPAAAFENLLAAHRGIILKVASTYCRDPHDRADLAQDIALQLWRAFPAFSQARPFSTWMYRIALNVAISNRRKQRDTTRGEPLENLHEELAGALDVDAEQRERLALVQTAMQALGSFDRALLLLHLEGFSNRGSGDILGISETNASTRLGRIRTQLRRVVGTQGEA